MVCEVTIDWANIITWLIVLSGWFIVHLATLSRERRKERREAVGRIIEEIKRVENLAVTFHTSEKFDPQLSDSLIWSINRVTRTLQRMPLKAINTPLDLMVRFRKRLTLQNTDASTFHQQNYRGEIIKGIRDVTDEMTEAIEAARDKIYS